MDKEKLFGIISAIPMLPGIILLLLIGGLVGLLGGGFIYLGAVFMTLGVIFALVKKFLHS